MFLTPGSRVGRKRATAGGVGTPGGSTLQVEYNNAGVFAGMSGTSWDDTNRSLTLTGATVTASKPVLDLSQTWSSGGVTFTGLKLNITNSASAAGSALLDLQIAGSSKFKWTNDPYFIIPSSASTSLYTVQGAFNSTGININGSGNVVIGGDGGGAALIVADGISVRQSSAAGIKWMNSSGSDATTSSWINVGAANTSGIIEQRLTTVPQTYRLYNTFTDASNYERGVFDWTTTANSLTIGAQAAGTGTLRGVTPVGTWTFAAAGPIVLNSIALNMVNSSVCNTVSAPVTAFGDGGRNVNGWYNYAGQARVTADVAFTSTTALATVTGLSVTLQAGRTYAFEACLQVTDAAAGGVQAAIAGTATATAIQYTGYTIADNAIKGKTNATALATAVGSTLTTETAGILVKIHGTITVNAAGTLLVQAAQNTSNGTATTVKRGSYFIVHDLP